MMAILTPCVALDGAVPLSLYATIVVGMALSLGLGAWFGKRARRRPQERAETLLKERSGASRRFW